ncbi:MAG: response regulator transcription factor [Verrucomicrobia bacterium]|nr:response regulator transcription factor [Verrucomicrobiota bacterium]
MEKCLCADESVTKAGSSLYWDADAVSRLESETSSASRPAEEAIVATSAAARVCNILLVDDHPLFRDGVRTRVEKQPDWRVCAEADTEAAALEAVRTAPPSLVILRLRLRNTDTIDLIKELQREKPGLPILVVGEGEEMLLAETALKAGARGFLLRDQAPEDLLAAIDAVLHGEVYLNNRLTSLILKKAYFGDQMDGVTRALSHRELQVFALIGLGYSTRDIATKLSLSRRTVNVHRENIKHKLGLKAAPHLVYAAVKWMQDRSSKSVEELVPADPVLA